MRSRKDILKVIGIVLVILFVGNFVFLSLIPKMIAFVSESLGYPLNSENLVIKYCMGIGVRAIGLILLLYILKRTQIIKLYSSRIDKTSLKLSWLFIVYIIANIEFGSVDNMKLLPVLLMMTESMMIGIYEETVFRGLVLPIFLRKWGKCKKQVIASVLISSILFGFVHLTNLLSGANLIAVLSQVCYATIIGIAFSALLLRTNGKLLWCGMLHGFYNMASGFGDFANKVDAGVQTNQTATAILPYVINLAFFIPMLLYGLFLLRKITSVTVDGVVCME